MRKKLIVILTISLLLCGCSTKEISSSNQVNSESVNNSQEDNTNSSDSEAVTDNTVIDVVTPSQVNIETTKEEEKETNDEKALNYFNYANDMATNYINNDDCGSAKSLFVTIDDFIFNDGIIKGVRFSDLSDAAKDKIVKIAIIIDAKIETKWPGYKDTIKTVSKRVYKNALEELKVLGNNLDKKLEDTLGDETYNIAKETVKDDISKAPEAIKKAASEVKDIGSSAVTSAKSIIKGLIKNQD